MKKIICLICLMLIVSSIGCGQQNQNQEYRLEKTKHGYAVFLPQEDYTFMNDVKVVLQDEQFVTHITFWSAICGYYFFMLPFTECPPVHYIQISQ